MRPQRALQCCLAAAVLEANGGKLCFSRLQRGADGDGITGQWGAARRYEVVETGPGGFFGAVIDESKGTAWFGIDDSPARLVKVAPRPRDPAPVRPRPRPHPRRAQRAWRGAHRSTLAR